VAASTRRRVIAAVAIGLAAIASTTGCDVLQGQRPDPKVMVLTVQDSTVTFMWCGDDAQFDSFWIENRQDRDFSSVTTEGVGEYRLSRGQTFTAESPPDGPEYSARGTIPIADGSSIYVGTLSNDGPGPNFRSAFNDVDLQSLPEGTWVTGDGEFTQEPCAWPDTPTG
jgi:hypothetical protein